MSSDPAFVASSKKNFYIFGKAIAFSMSPTIHKAAYRHYGLPHDYQIYMTEDVEGFAPLVSSEDFGGASVTMPHKLLASKVCDEVTDDAKIIGAINTLIPDDSGSQRKIVGENTDWLGLLSTIETLKTIEMGKLETGLVIGAGGASRAALYAMHKSGIKGIYLWNRTYSTAEEVAKSLESSFHIEIVKSLQDFNDKALPAPEVIIGTIPAEYTTAADFPERLFEKTYGITIDMSYKPRDTPLLITARRHPGWKTAAGVNVLLEQAYHQFKMWLGLDAPKQAMSDALFEQDEKTAKLA